MGLIGAAASSTSSSTTAAQQASANNNLSLAGNFTTFLNLLTTQLKNQDPTAPMDANTFTQQLVAFAGVQQQSQTNTTLSSILAALQTNQVSSAASFVGTTVQAPGNQVALTNGTANISYTLSSAATSAQVTITDSSGNTVFSGSSANNPAGTNTVSWNGQNSFTGAQEPDGTYTVSIKATDKSGTAVTATPFISGTVTSASVSNGAVMLNIGSLQVPESSVTTVTNLTGTKSATTTTPTTTNTAG